MVFPDHIEFDQLLDLWAHCEDQFDPVEAPYSEPYVFVRTTLADGSEVRLPVPALYFGRPGASQARETFVYFIQRGVDGPIKIGFSRDPEKRLRVLQQNVPERLRLIGAQSGGFNEEHQLHERFAASRIRRTEWFEPSADIVAYICQGGSQ
jgi:hypothetical protein